MITRDQAQLLLEIDENVSNLGHADRTWRENSAYYAVMSAGHPHNAAVVFVNKSSGQIQHARYAVVEALLDAMRPVN